MIHNRASGEARGAGSIPPEDPAAWMIGETPVIRAIRDQLQALAKTDYSVLIEGETGTGKDVAAYLLHAAGRRAHKPFVVVNCAALPETLFENEVFGHGRGAFTGADSEKPGLFESAHQGTLFLDEIAELSVAMQAKLLRALETGTFQRLGSVRPTRVDARVVAATNRDLGRLVADGKFRADLYYRLRVVTVRMPPLRDRRSDVPLLAAHFLQGIARRLGRPNIALSQEAANALSAFSWPGNVRQLLHELEGACLQAGDRVELAHLSPEIRETAGVRFADRRSGMLQGWERDEIERGLARTKWNVTALARELRMSRRTLTDKIHRLGLKRPRARPERRSQRAEDCSPGVTKR